MAKVSFAEMPKDRELFRDMARIYEDFRQPESDEYWERLAQAFTDLDEKHKETSFHGIVRAYILELMIFLEKESKNDD